MMEKDTILNIQDLSKSFGNESILEKISIECQTGKIYGIMGRNGSGKSVFFKCICGFLKPTSGKILLNGQEIESLKEWFPKRIGTLIESPEFLGNLNGYQNLKLLYTINNKVDKIYLHQILKKVGLPEKSRKPVAKYSMGMKQRLGIAQAIMEEQELLLLDEPFNGLDDEGVREIRELFLKMKTEKIILITSHNKEDLEILCDEIYRLEQGNFMKIK